LIDEVPGARIIISGRGTVIQNLEERLQELCCGLKLTTTEKLRQQGHCKNIANPSR
jgi:hypothetical protein